MNHRPVARTVLACAAILAFVAPAALAQVTKVGVFDPQRVSEETALGKQVQVQLTAFRDRKQSEVTEKQQAIEELRKQLSQQALSLSSEKRGGLEKDIQHQLLDLESSKERATREMQLEVSAAQSTFQDKLLQVVQALGQDEGFALILDSSMIAWAAKEVDVTTAIVDRFDRMFPTQQPPKQ